MFELFADDTPNARKVSIMLEEIKFDYKVGYAFTPTECQTILKDLERQKDKFLVTDDHGDLCLSVYESEISNLDDSFTLQKLINRSMDLYVHNDDFRKQINEWENLKPSGSAL